VAKRASFAKVHGTGALPVARRRLFMLNLHVT
jgi:hypothetical protein